MIKKETPRLVAKGGGGGVQPSGFCDSPLQAFRILFQNPSS